MCRSSGPSRAAGAVLFVLGPIKGIFYVRCVAVRSHPEFFVAVCLFSCLTIAVSGKFLLVCFLPVIGWAVWCLKKQKQQHEVDATEMQVQLVVFPHTALFVNLLASSDNHLQTFRPPSNASAAWNAHLSQLSPPLPSPLPQLAQAGHYHPQHATAPPLSLSAQMYEPRNLRGSAVLAIPGGGIASV
jgi:hypothetical protein